MTTKRILHLIILIPLGLIILRVILLPKPVKAEFGLTGFSNRYFSIGADSGLINNKKITKTVVYEGFFSLDKTLDKLTSQRLIEVLQDSSNYRWGEEGTPDFKTRLVYYDELGTVLGDTQLSSSGQSYTSPTIKKISKWGMLNKKGLQKIVILIN